MKIYYYFLFRIYHYYKNRQSESENNVLFSTTVVSSLILNFHLIGVYFAANYFGLAPILTNKFYMILFMVVVGFFNYWFLIKRKLFLNYGFQKTKKGGIYVILYVVFLGITLLILANINRERIFEERRKNPSVEQIERRPSLEGKIRKWFQEN